MIGVLYTQVEDLMDIGDDQLDFMEDVDIGINSITSSDTDTMQVRIESSEEAPVNLTEVLRLEYSKGGSSSLEADAFDNAYEDVTYDETEEGCFEEDTDDEQIDPLEENDQITCDTGVSWPEAGETITVHLVERGSGDDADSYSCSSSTGDEPVC